MRETYGSSNQYAVSAYHKLKWLIAARETGRELSSYSPSNSVRMSTTGNPSWVMGQDNRLVYPETFEGIPE